MIAAICFSATRIARQGVEQVRLRFPGQWSVTMWDTLTGTSSELPITRCGVETSWEWSFPPHGHLLVMLTPFGRSVSSQQSAVSSFSVCAESNVPTCELTGSARVPACPVILTEPNVLPLDLARWRWNDAPWQPREELLRIEDSIRNHLGLPLRRSYNAQPWCDHLPATPLGQLTLEFDIVCACDIPEVQLALEHPGNWQLTLDNRPLAVVDAGWWVDEAIRTAQLPSLTAGDHRLRFTTDFTRSTALEWCYLLGNFGVSVAGVELCMTAPVTGLAWGDWTAQGLPFYTGNVTYYLPFTLEQRAAVRVYQPSFANPLLRLAVDGHDVGIIAFAPYTCELGELSTGRHELTVTVFGTRNNAFGCLHHPGPDNRMPGPNHWHTNGASWSYSRHVSAKGLLQQPVIEYL